MKKFFALLFTIAMMIMAVSSTTLDSNCLYYEQ